MIRVAIHEISVVLLTLVSTALFLAAPVIVVVVARGFQWLAYSFPL